MINKYFKIILLIIGNITFSASAISQFRLETSLSTIYDNNINNNYLQLSDHITSASLSAAYDWETERQNTQLYYQASLSYFNSSTSRTFHYHSTGLTYSHLYGDESETALNLGGSYSFRLNREDYTFYNLNQLSAFANIKFPLSEQISGKASYSFRSLSFSELPDFNYFEHYGFVQTTISLPTRTTLIMEADLGSKIYMTPNIDTTAQEFGTYSRGGNMSETSTPTVTQLIGVARIGQSIVSGTGLSWTSQYQINLDKESRYLSSDGGMISDDELFDDHYGYEGWQTSLLLTQLFPEEIVLKIGGSYQYRTYTNRPAYDLLNNIIAPTRIDKRKSISFELGKRFEALGLSLGVTYDYIINDSNDEFYNYTNNAMNLELSFSY